jgi:lincosamide nucleotidyltransferase A/C/D/E
MVIATLQEADLRVWIDGGWGVDALLGEVTRRHEDVDLVVELAALGAVFERLFGLGFSVTEDLSPVRVVMRSPRVGKSISIPSHSTKAERDGRLGQLRTVRIVHIPPVGSQLERSWM